MSWSLFVIACLGFLLSRADFEGCAPFCVSSMLWAGPRADAARPKESARASCGPAQSIEETQKGAQPSKSALDNKNPIQAITNGTRNESLGASELKYQNKRADYLAAWWNTVNWDRAAANFAKAPA
jgi:Iron/manganese superoxide dismutases, C-terminal domain